ncbi:hypothetical protein [Herbaspirillum rhizosphaerae]|uniref:hypothetical protein n=1 Tax=Herbaspirillum rhizosphaerae TaxID=346179 RepID=UPI00067BFB81|nr:hypothetical protein [Herbaspirillum rhizosphaerae]
MSSIIVGRFQLQDETEYAVDELVQAGYPRDAITTFYLNPAGQHDLYPVGGDRDKSPGAKDTDAGVAAGAATGAIVGATVGSATAPVTGPVGPALGGLVGAHVGSLVGSLNATDDTDRGLRHTQEVEVRKAGMRVAVEVEDTPQENQAIALLHSLKAADIERSEGHIDHGDWDDFDPLTPPRYVDLQGNRSYTGRI